MACPTGCSPSKGFDGPQLLLQKLDVGPLRLFTCLSLSVSTKCISKENSRHQTATDQPGGGPGIVLFAGKTCFASIFGCFWSDQRLKISCHECIAKQQKPNVMMFGSFAPVLEARRASTTVAFSAHREAFVNTSDRVKVQF